MGKIEDIKFLRDKTGCGIASAKKAIDLCKNRKIALIDSTWFEMPVLVAK